MLHRHVPEKDLSSQGMALLRPLFKSTSIDGKMMNNPRNFDNEPWIIILKNAWDFIAASKDSFPKLRMALIESPVFQN